VLRGDSSPAEGRTRFSEQSTETVPLRRRNSPTTALKPLARGRTVLPALPAAGFQGAFAKRKQHSWIRTDASLGSSEHQGRQRPPSPAPALAAALQPTTTACRPARPCPASPGCKERHRSPPSTGLEVLQQQNLQQQLLLRPQPPSPSSDGPGLPWGTERAAPCTPR